jgi:hypothetical protein
VSVDVGARIEDAEEAEQATQRRFGPLYIIFFTVFAIFSIGALSALALGVGAVWAHFSPAMHDSLHVRALGVGLSARAALRMADASHEVGSLGGVVFDYAFSLVNFSLAIFLLWLRPRDRPARLLAIALVGVAGAFNLTAQTAVEIVPLTGAESFAQAAAHTIAGLTYIFALLLFPNGRPVPRWRASALVPLYTAIAVCAIFLTLRVQGTARPAALVLFFGLAVPVAGAAAQFYRLRWADSATEHTQARLLFWALVPALVVGAYFVVTQGFGTVTDAGLAGRHLPEQPVAVFRIFQPVFLLVPLALFIGLLRYRLWDIDRVVNRTLVYGLATGLVGGATLGIVVLLQRLLSPFTTGNDIAVALSTLLFAAAFIPVRRRVQNFVDRRFYRQRYDAQRTIEAFASRLRDQLDLEALAFELRGAVARTMQPSNVTLLLRNPEGKLEWQWTYKGQARD